MTAMQFRFDGRGNFQPIPHFHLDPHISDNRGQKFDAIIRSDVSDHAAGCRRTISLSLVGGQRQSACVDHSRVLGRCGFFVSALAGQLTNTTNTRIFNLDVEAPWLCSSIGYRVVRCPICITMEDYAQLIHTSPTSASRIQRRCRCLRTDHDPTLDQGPANHSHLSRRFCCSLHGRHCRTTIEWY